MFRKILIAARGEIAVRVIRTCREMGISTVAVYSEADKESLHVQLADESVCIGPAKAVDSYLNMNNIVTAALQTSSTAVHPGYGFLSENAEFVDLLTENGIKFIGPSAELIRKMGSKHNAREMMIEAGIPTPAGSAAALKNKEEALEIADSLEFPILIKASAGGGGRGMRVARDLSELAKQFETAQQEAISCFGNGEMYLEKLIENPRHIEFQILADKHGNVVHLGERECSIQRRNQKMLEETPSKALSESLRKKMGEAAVRASKAMNYENAGTIEFVLDKNSNFYFIEVNTRIQVEHPVTEMIYGVDIVKEQIRVAAGLELAFKQEDLKSSGHSIECRINAEDYQKNFAPNCGIVDFIHFPLGNGVRIDSEVYAGLKLSPFYDSMIAKIIVHAPSRLEAIRKMRRALEEFLIQGLKTTADFHHLLMFHPDFLKGEYDTSFIEKNLQEILDFETSCSEKLLDEN